MRKILLTSLPISLLLSGCASKTEPPKQPQPEPIGVVEFADVFLYGTSFNSVYVRPIFSNPNIKEKEIFTYESENPEICEVRDNLLVYKSEGNTTIKAKSANFDSTFKVCCVKSFKFSPQFNSMMTKYRADGKPTGDTLFIGDSFFEFWKNNAANRKFDDDFKNKKVYNIGISGTQTHHWRPYVSKFIKQMNPKNIILNIGINNVDDNGETGLNCYKNVVSFIEDLHEELPEAKLYYFSITRCTGFFASKWTDHKLSNSKVKSYCETNKSFVQYLDVMEIFGDNYADYHLADGLHPNAKAYGVFKQLIEENVSIENK